MSNNTINAGRVARDHFNGRMGCADDKTASLADSINHAAIHELPNFAALDRR